MDVPAQESDELMPVVFDLGEYGLKAGEATRDAPTLIASPRIGVPRDKSKISNSYCFSVPLATSSDVNEFRLKSCYEKGQITDWTLLVRGFPAKYILSVPGKIIFALL